jgi:adenylate cyclase
VCVIVWLAVEKPSQEMRLVRFGPFEANFTTGELRKHGVRVKLQEQPFQVLKILLLRPGELVTREQIRQSLWPSGTFVDFDNGLNAAINRLREALGDSAEDPRLIETLPRRGYRFVGALSEPAASGGQPLTPAYPVPDLERLKRDTDSVRVTESVKAEAKSLAVLYFENLSGSKEDEYFRDGITEDVTTELSKIRELTPFPRSAVLAYRDKPITAPQVGQQLGAAYVLEGSLRRAGNRLRITTHLVETRTGHTVWAERYDREMKDVFEVQDEIARSISQALQIKLSPQEERAIARKPTESAQAYDYYLRGRQYFHQLRRKSLDFARQMFARAIVIDPRYARAYAGVADCCSFIYMYWDTTADNLNEADAASRKALELDSELAEAHASRGTAVSLSKNWEEAEREFETAIHLNPKLYDAYYFYARTCLWQGKFAKAAELFEQACRVNPDDYQAAALLVGVYKSLGLEAEATSTKRRALQGAEKQIEFHPDDARALYFGASMLGQLGDRARSLEWAKRALEIDPDDTGILYNVACVYAQLGEAEEALTCLEKVLTYGTWFKDWAENDSDLAPLRSDPRFQVLMKSP